MNSNEKPYDLSMLLEMDAEEPGSLVKILQIFLESIPEVLNDFMNCFNNKDYTNLGSAAHKLKSSIDLLGLTEISALLKKIELSAKNGEDTENIPTWVNHVNITMNNVFGMLKEEIKERE